MTAVLDAPPRRGVSPRARLLIAMGCCLAAVALFLMLNAKGDPGFILAFRGRKVAAMALVGWATGIATVVFQTVTNNRLLTPSILGLDALYVFIQSLLVLVLGITFVAQVGSHAMFGLNTAIMVATSAALAGVLFGKRARSVYVVVLAGLVLGSILRAASALIARILDPTAYLALQSQLFASFSAVEPELLWLCAVIVAAATWYLWRQRHSLDVVTLGRDAAVSLGVPYRRVVLGVMLVAVLLVCVSTALVGPITFLGLIIAAIAYHVVGTGRHTYTAPMAGLLGVGVLIGGQAVLEHGFKMGTVLSVIIEFIGGIAFIWLVMRKARA